MPPKRPEPLGRIAVDPKKEAVSITDTLTLVVKGEGGLEMRVKESGIDQRHTTAPAVPSPAADGGSISNKLKFDDLRIGGELGKGSQGKVRVVQHRVTNEKFALKYISFESNSDDIILPLSAELRRVAAVKHQNLVSSYEAFFREGRLYIVLEYMNAGTMKDIIQRHPKQFTEPILAYIARELFQGLAYLHSLKIIHRDIKPANVLANSRGEVKISDFGVAKTFVGGDLKTLSSQGSVPYMSPERIKSEPYSFDCDVWSAGLCLGECALGEFPFFNELNKNIFELCHDISSGAAKINWDQPGLNFSAECKDFIESCLKPEAERPSAAQQLQHPFLEKAKGLDPMEVGKWFMG
eukprot:gene3900-2769_t